MSISSAQARAAQGLLKMNIKDVYTSLGISRQAYYNFLQRGIKTYEEEIRNFFVLNGIEFSPYDGVRRNPNQVRILKGASDFKTFLDSVYHSANANGGNICVTNVDERKFEYWQGVYAQMHLERMAQVKNIDFRILVCEGDDYYTASAYAQYKKLPKKYFGETPIYIYGNKSAEIIFEDNDVTIIETTSKALAETKRKNFDLHWELAFA